MNSLFSSSEWAETNQKNDESFSYTDADPGQDRSIQWPTPQPIRQPGARFSKTPETFQARKAIAKSRTLRFQSCFIHLCLIKREVPFIQEVSGVKTSPFLDTDDLN